MIDVQKVVAPATNLEKGQDITIKDVEDILNNVSKDKKEALLSIWNQVSERYANIVAVQILVKGRIVAASQDAFIVELQDAGFCNRVMQYENYVKIVEILNEFGLNIKDYICLPESAWKKIALDYKRKYSKDNPKPVLEDFPLGVRKRVIPTVKPKDDDASIVSDVLEFFDDNELKIVEE